MEDPVAAAAVISSPPPNSGISPVGSPETSDPHLDEVPRPSDEHSYLAIWVQPKEASFGSQCGWELGYDVIYGFEVVDVNELEIDYIKVVSLAFNQLKMKKLAREKSVIVAALKDSSLLVVSSDEKKVKRLHPLPFTEVKDPQLCTVLVENLPEDHSTENIRKIFGEAGNIKNICIRDPDAVRQPRKCTIEEKLLSGKLHALVEFETVEAAEKAVATLNDEKDWRYGMRVKFLKRMGKRELKKKSLRGPDSEKSSSARESDLAVDEENHVSNLHHDDIPNGELLGSSNLKYGCRSRHRVLRITAMDQDVASSSFNEWVDNEVAGEYSFSSSEGEESDGEVILNPITDVELPSIRESFRPTDDALTVTAHRLAMMGRARKKSRQEQHPIFQCYVFTSSSIITLCMINFNVTRSLLINLVPMIYPGYRIRYGIFINMGLMTFLTALVLLVDSCAWRIVRLPLSPFHLMRPFSTSAVLVSCAGYIGVPLLRMLKMRSIIKNEGPSRHSLKKGTPTMGGLFFVPIGIIVAEVIVGFSSIEVSGVAAATLAFAVIGLSDDFLSLLNHNSGLSTWMRIFLEVAVGAWFSFWLCTTKISSPYSIKMVVPLPVPVGLLCLGKCYPLLTSFTFVSMANGVKLTDGLDGLAGGTAALAFIGMSVAVLPICSDLAVFGASMAGACVGFLLHNRYKASVFMGDTGALALGGALAAMAACTGMFFPLFISSGIYVLEALSVIMQVSFFKTTKHIQGTGRRLFRMAPLHHHLELCGLKEPAIVAGACVISSLLMLCAAYAGLVSA
ncbi:hypothetical protein RJ640_024440 [Escallonia rubra]|uniref:RRM domain-containing protein n=1 Tax=Escallonia rubra TaxID=112253 RepID=A0AA88RE89_9ASTE|nr:hypothetical protein RJ640_024440 [Escallonia rubra]